MTTSAELEQWAATALTPLTTMPEQKSRAVPYRPAMWAAALLLYLIAVVGHVSAADAGLLAFALATVLYSLRNVPGQDATPIAVVTLLAAAVGYPFAHLPHDRTTSYVVVVFALMTTFSGRGNGRRVFGTRGQFLIIGLFLVLLTTSAFSPDAGAVKQLIAIVAIALPIFILVSHLTQEGRRSVFLAVVSLAIIESVLAVLEPFAFPKHLWGPAQVDDQGNVVPLFNPIISRFERSQGTFGHPLPLGLFLVIALALLVRVDLRLSRLLRLACISAVLLGLAFTGDQSCLLLAAIVLVAGRSASGVPLVSRLAGAAVAFVALVSIGVLRSSMVGALFASGSFTHRSGAYSALGNLLFSQSLPATFFGNGFASTPRMFNEGLLQTDGFRAVDNEFVSMVSQGGLICTLFLISLCFAGIYRAPRELRVVTICVVACMLVFDSLLWPSATAMTFLALSLALNRPPSPDSGLIEGKRTSAVW